jgi:dolichyl-diphosphooligosaccharide--protein glycosyltransferase
VFHCTWVTQAAYSSPSIVVARGNGPQDGVLDDFREAYGWIRENTADDATIMSWWDYGYQVCLFVCLFVCCCCCCCCGGGCLLIVQ